MIMVIVLFFAAIALLLKSNIDVKIRILGEIPTLGGGQADKFGSLHEKGLYLVKGSELNTYIAKDAGFNGDAKAFSKINEDALVLCNSRGSGWANYEIYLKEPLNLNRLDIKYMARGESGD